MGNVLSSQGRPKSATMATTVPLAHYVQLVLHRKWIIVGVFILVTIVTIAVVQALPNIYMAQTLILVDPQKVPETYVKSTITGSVRDRLSTLSQQILSATRLQKIVDDLHLYQNEKKKMAREEIIAQMRTDITTTVVSDFGAGQDLQAFRISYSGTDPRQVAAVTNQLANLFIDENLKAREQQSAGTTEFIENQLHETRKALEDQEGQLRDFRLKHVGEMPEQQSADLQILGNLQNQVQVEADALSRAEQQKTLLQSMMTQTVPVVNMDSASDDTGLQVQAKAGPVKAATPKKTGLAEDRDELARLRTRYSDSYPDVIKLKKKIQQEEALAATTHEEPAVTTPPKVPVPPPSLATTATAKADTRPGAPPVQNHFNPVLQAQIEAADAEIAKHREELERLSKTVAKYQAKLEVIPVREQETMALTRDYEMTKQHYAQLETQALSAETATQLEYRQKGQRFVVLDPAIAPEKPTKPNRPLLDVAGAFAGLLLGFVLALLPEFFGMTIVGPQDISSAGNLTILETIPVIMTRSDQVARKRRMIVAAASVVLTSAVAGTLLFLRLRNVI
jgi:polysaccharide biosynthesis transport protein